MTDADDVLFLHTDVGSHEAPKRQFVFCSLCNLYTENFVVPKFSSVLTSVVRCDLIRLLKSLSLSPAKDTKRGQKELGIKSQLLDRWMIRFAFYAKAGQREQSKIPVAVLRQILKNDNAKTGMR